MSKVWMMAAAAMVAGWASVAGAQCSAVCDEVTVQECDSSGAVIGETTTHTITQCNAPDPAAIEPGVVCGEVCADGAAMVAGQVTAAGPEGCISVGGGAAHSNQLTNQDPDADYAQCVIEAADACDAGGCSTTSDPADGGCPGGSIVRSSSTQQCS